MKPKIKNLPINELKNNHNGQVIRLAMLSTHYTQPFDWNKNILENSRKSLEKWYEFYSDEPESINDAMSKAANGPLKGILAVNSAPLVSKDFNHNPHSSIFDLTQTQVIKGKFSRVLSWYDNEWGFSNRMCDTAIQIAGLI